MAINPPKLNFSVPGNHKIREFLQKSLVNDKLSHAYLFTGPSGIGKKTIAYDFFQAIACYKSSHDKVFLPCRQCETCQQFERHKYPQLYFLKKDSGEKNIGIDAIRDLRRQLSLRSDIFKFVLIDQAHELSLEAANSFLKILEEPYGQTIYVLVTDTLEYLPKTVISRCQNIRFHPLSKKMMIDQLTALDLDKKEVKEIAGLSQGRYMMARKLMSDKNYLSEYYEKSELLFRFYHDDLNARFMLLNETMSRADNQEKNPEFIRILEIWQNLFRDAILIKIGLNDYVVNYTLTGRIASVFKNATLEHLKNNINALALTTKLIRQNINLKLLLENYLINL